MSSSRIPRLSGRSFVAVRPTIFVALLPWAPACRYSVPVELATDSSDGSTGTGTTDAPPMSSTGADETGTSDPTNTETAGASSCGDSELQGDEHCDDGINDGSYGGCLPDCSAPAGHCGDGLVQPEGDEGCDDGDAVDGNGCNTDCRPSGMVVWEWTYDVEGLAMDVGVGEAIHVAGWRSSVPRAAWAAQLNHADGAISWTYVLESPGVGQSRFNTTKVIDEDEIIFGGYHDGNGRLVGLDGSGSAIYSAPVFVPEVHDLVLLDDGDRLVRNASWVHRFDGFVEEWSADLGPGIAQRPGDDEALAVIVDPVGFRRFSIGDATFGTTTFPMPVGITGLGRAVAWTSGGDVILAGSAVGDGAEDVLIMRSSYVGELRWIYGPEQLHEQYRQAFCLAVDSKDAVIVGGVVWLFGQLRPAVMKFSSEGELLWVRDVAFEAPDGRVNGCTTNAADEIIAVGESIGHIWAAKLTP